MKKEVICILAIFQIILLINAIIAQPYLIHQAEHPDSNASISNKAKDITKKAIILLGAVLSIKQIGTVSATSTVKNNSIYSTPTYLSTSSSSSFSVGCCQELKSGAICEDILRTDTSSCKTSILPAECSKIDSCRLGCCIDSIEGTCAPKSSKGKCEAEGGTWNSNVNCQVAQCQKGCCVLGGSAKFVNEKTCGRLSLLYGFKKDFKDLDTEIECIALSASQEIGACVYPGGGCSFKTEKECLQNLGKFSKGNLCSNPSLETNCTKQASVGCVEGKDEIYWFDSCGNVENIYNSDKTASWNNGKVLLKAQSCNPTLSNINSTTCGNCNRALSSVCNKSSDKKIVDGNFVCKSLECRDAEGNKRANGESWCVYDSYVGDGKDTVGSEHWKAFCNKGNVEVDRCGDYRGRICVQSIMESGTKNFSIAACVTNTAFECTMYNSEKETMVKNCEENEFCLIKNINIASGFSFDYCSARYPKGFNPDLFETNNKICDTASTKCSVTYKKGFFSGWSCSDNCECETKAFTDKMNDLCISLGDCGSYVNFKGNGTNNAIVSGAPATNWKEYLNWGGEHIDYSKSVKGQYAKSQDLNTSLYLLLGALPEGMDEETMLTKTADIVGKVAGGVGLVAYGLGALNIGTGGYVFLNSVAEGATAILSGSAGTTGAQIVTATTASGAPIAPAGTIAVSAGSVAACAAGAAIGAMLGSYIASSQGITGTPAAIITIAGAVAGAIIGYALWAGKIAAIYPIGTIVAVVMIVIIAIISLSGWGKTDIRTVSFKCLPWEAPLGGDDCSKCQDDPLKPCTEYRCQSLGQACILLNPESEIPECKSIPRETIAPIISPGEPGEGYKFENITQNGLNFVGKDKKCITEFTPVSFTLKTDEHAQCIYSNTFPQSKQFEDMGELGYPQEGNVFTINHTFGIFMPSLGSLSVYDIAGDLKEKYGKMNMYVRCRDYWGNYNLDEYIVNFCVNSGPDLTPVNHLYTIMDPQTKTKLKYGTTEVNVDMYINEPAECKYSNSSDKTYNEMENSITCETDVQRVTDIGWQCNMTMLIPEEENKIYLKCKDQPWLAGTINETNRNINQEDYEYVLYVSKSELNITGTYILPSPNEKGVIVNGIEPFPVSIEVRTSGGAEEGVAICYWGENLDIPFYETFSTIHKQPGVNTISGKYSIPIKCEDSAKNIATSEINFSVELDTTPPMAIRTYREGNNLIVLTDEKAECYSSLNTCSFDTANATSMTTALSTTHRAPWEPGETYYVKCKDVWGNTNPWCAIRVQPE